ncbi:MAG: arylesterase [gamma proteobacterium symbiont of Lucinoma myriamae]|nr:arylesterase [gamma proteobacterium symbiont of Lucinoma myriamae]MCU7818942.1 arylesterase [gamma proteobacterium symbiont of Lucinoma myriamae]MCU7833447.1 arylesterase [gamma proteobacterium symbiont of Lucinoma myriamae]
MMKSVTQFFLSIFIVNALSICVLNQFACANEKEMGARLLILGDSLSAGYGIKQGKNWTDLLQNKLSKNNNYLNNSKIHIVNASISGDTSANGLNRLPETLKQHQPAWVIIELGANDGLRGLPISHIRHNLEVLIKTSLAANAKVFLMEIKIPPNYGRKYTQAFNHIYHQLAAQYELMLLDFMLDDIILKPELMQADGLHPNEKAQVIISEYLWRALKPLLEAGLH